MAKVKKKNWQYEVLVKIQNDWNSQTCGANANGRVALENTLACTFTKLHTHLGIYLNENLGHTKTCIQMFVATLFIIIKTKEPKCPSESKRTNRLCYIHTIGYYSATQKEQASGICNLDESHRPPWKKASLKGYKWKIPIMYHSWKKKIIVAEELVVARS